MRSVIPIVYILTLGLLVLSAPPISAADKAPAAKSAEARTVNLELKDIPVREAIAKLFEGTGLKYSVEPGVSGRVVEIKLKGVTFQEGLDALGEAARFTYRVKQGVYVISPVFSASTGSGPSRAPAYTEPQPEKKEAPSTQQAQKTTPGQQATSSGNVLILEQSPTYYGQPSLGYYGSYGYDAYPPFYQFGSVRIFGGYPPVVVAGGSPYVMRRVYPPPPPPGFVGSDAERFLRGQWAIRGQTIITPY